jgi:hypothetical protein
MKEAKFDRRQVNLAIAVPGLLLAEVDTDPSVTELLIAASNAFRQHPIG